MRDMALCETLCHPGMLPARTLRTLSPGGKGAASSWTVNHEKGWSSFLHKQYILDMALEQWETGEYIHHSPSLHLWRPLICFLFLSLLIPGVSYKWNGIICDLLSLPSSVTVRCWRCCIVAYIGTSVLFKLIDTIWSVTFVYAFIHSTGTRVTPTSQWLTHAAVSVCSHVFDDLTSIFSGIHKVIEVVKTYGYCNFFRNLHTVCNWTFLSSNQHTLSHDINLMKSGYFRRE